jgi:outer membrane receptor protein involved in Fe transport
MAQDQSVETVVVTGSRIPQTGLYSSSPVTAVGQQELKFQGTTSVDSLISSLPSAFTDYGNQSSAFSGALGTASVDLRGLGSVRTLVLIDGRRLMPGDPILPVADVNQIPAALVDHVEVLTGGASATYGSDALAGVVNFVMRKDFEGIELDGQYSTNQLDNNGSTRGVSFVTLDQSAPNTPAVKQNVFLGGTADATLIMGMNSDNGKGNITAYVGYRDIQSVGGSQVDYANCTLHGDYTSKLSCGGSSNYNRWISFDTLVGDGQNVIAPSGASVHVSGGLDGVPGDFFETGTGAAGSGTFAPYTGASSQKYNFGNPAYVQQPSTRYTAGFSGHYEVSKMFDVYTDFMFDDTSGRTLLSPSAVFEASGPAKFPGTNSAGYQQVNCANPLMTAQENANLCGQILPTTPYQQADPTTGNLVLGGLPTYKITDPVTGNPATVANPCYGDTTLAACYGAAGPDGNGYDALVGGRYNGGANLTPGQALLYIGRRNIEGGDRTYDTDHTGYRMVVGTKGDLGGGWTYDVYGQYGTTVFQQHETNALSQTRVENALQVVQTPTGPECLSVVNGYDPNCVPLDIFNGIGSITPAMLAYSGFQDFETGYTQEAIVSGSVTGDLGSWGLTSPWAKDPVAVSVGSEYRQEKLKFDSGYGYQHGDEYGTGPILPTPLSGFNVAEGFGEVRIPVIQGLPFAEDLSINGGYRYSSYSNVGAVRSWKYGLEWQPIDDIRFRASQQRAVRAPNVLESFKPAAVGLFSGNDPCAASTAGQCAFVNHSGNASLLTCPAAQCNVQAGGNSSLKPEISDTTSLGLVFTPTFFDGFTLTIDYFRINVDDYIGTLGATTILSGCYSPTASAVAVAFYCPLVHRSGNGTIFGAGYVQDLDRNLPYLRTKGVDFEANYTADLDDWGVAGAGSLGFNFLGTMLSDLVTAPSPASLNSAGHLQTYDCAGLFGATCGEPAPRWRHKLRVTWTSPWDFDVSLDWRHLGSTGLDLNKNNPILTGGTNPHADPTSTTYIPGFTCSNGAVVYDCANRKISAYDYFDVAANWQVREGVELRAGVNNIFDKEPPIVASSSSTASPIPFGADNTFPGTYDALGRNIFVGATIKY